MAFNVNDFKGALVGGGARSSLFYVELTTPFAQTLPTSRFMVKAAQIPAATLGQIDVPYFGRQIKVAGNRTFAEWTPTIINDESFEIRTAMENWSSRINAYIGNTNTTGSGNPENYKSDATVIQFSQTGNAIKSYKFVGLFPTEVSTIDLAWDAEGIQDFTTTFVYDYWETDSVSTTFTQRIESFVSSEVQTAINRGIAGVTLGQ